MLDHGNYRSNGSVYVLPITTKRDIKHFTCFGCWLCIPAISGHPMHLFVDWLKITVFRVGKAYELVITSKVRKGGNT